MNRFFANITIVTQVIITFILDSFKIYLVTFLFKFVGRTSSIDTVTNFLVWIIFPVVLFNGHNLEPPLEVVGAVEVTV